MRKFVLSPRKEIARGRGSHGFAACSLLAEDHPEIWQGKAELPANVWDMKPDDFPLPKELTCIHDGDFPAPEVFRTKMVPFGKTYPG